MKCYGCGAVARNAEAAYRADWYPGPVYRVRGDDGKPYEFSMVPIDAPVCDDCMRSDRFQFDEGGELEDVR